MQDWDKRSDELEKDLPKVGRYPASGLVRRARRMVDLSQRQFAKFAHVSASTVSKVESGEMAPSLAVMQRLLAAAGLYLVAVDQDGRLVEPMRDIEDTRDGANRRYPAHLDVVLDPQPGEWWGDWYGLARPPETFYRSKERRDIQRARSQWETRAKQFRNVPPPPDWEGIVYLREQDRQRRLRPIGPRPGDSPDWSTDEWDVDEWEGDSWDLDGRDGHGLPGDGSPDDGSPDDRDSVAEGLLAQRPIDSVPTDDNRARRDLASPPNDAGTTA